MPIRQDRMMALINAATDYRSLAWMVQKWFAHPHLQHMSQPELLTQINSWSLQLDEAIRDRAGEHNEVINAEYNKFHRNAARNEREKIKMQIKRGQQVKPTRRQPKVHSKETTRLRPAFTDDIYLAGPGLEAQSQIRRKPETPQETAELEAIVEANKRALEAEEAERNQPFKNIPLTFPTEEETEE